MTQVCSPVLNKTLSSLLEPYNEAGKHFTIAFEGKVEGASQRIFANNPTTTSITWGERILHVLTGAIFAIPLINYISYYVFSFLGMLIDPSNIQPNGSSFRAISLAEREGLSIDEPFTREYPKGGLNDTVRFNRKNKRLEFAHGHHVFLFEDEEILRVHRKKKTKELDHDIKVFYAEDGRAVIQQVGMRGCPAGAVSMIIVDAGGAPDIAYLRFCNLDNDEGVQLNIRKVGLTPNVTHWNTLRELRNLLRTNGSAVLGIGDKNLGGHYIVVDEVSSDLSSVKIRDPYHGWQITVKASAFLKRSRNGDLIHIKK